MLPNKYCESIFKTVRRPTRTINVSASNIGRDCSRQWREKGRSEQSRQTNRARKQASGSGATLTSLAGGNLDLFPVILLFSPTLTARRTHHENKTKTPTQIGNVKVGSEHPVRLQTMTTTGE